MRESVEAPDYVKGCFLHGQRTPRPWETPFAASWQRDTGLVNTVFASTAFWSYETKTGRLYLRVYRRRGVDLDGIIVLDQFYKALPDNLNITVWVNNARGTADDPATYWYPNWKACVAGKWTIFPY